MEMCTRAGQVADECFFHHFHQIENNATGGFIRNDGLDIENEGECQHHKSGQHQNSLRIQFPVEVNSGDGDHQYTEEEGYDLFYCLISTPDYSPTGDLYWNL